MDNSAVFGLTAGILLFEVVLFSIFGKADIQVGGRKINSHVHFQIHLDSMSLLRLGTALKEAELRIGLPTVFWCFRELFSY